MTASDNSPEQVDHPFMRSFGRRRSRRLTARQQGLVDGSLQDLALDLSMPAPLDPTALFTGSTGETWLEIGFGGGEHFLWQARKNPGVGLIGCEPFIDGMVKVLDGAASDRLQNVRLFDDDARFLLEWLPPRSISKAFVLFPDPWPKKRHRKRRLVNQALLDKLAQVLIPGAELRLATDIEDYARAMLLAVRRQRSFQWTARQPSDWRCRSDDWPQTRYEQKAIREGRLCYFMKFKLVT